MKGLSLTQPWANALFLNLKHFETRSWSTNYRGVIYIHAAKGFPKYAKDFAVTERALGRGDGRLPFGALIGTVELIGVQHTEFVALRVSAIERLYGDYSAGRFAWEFRNPIHLAEPIPYRGALGLFEVSLPK